MIEDFVIEHECASDEWKRNHIYKAMTITVCGKKIFGCKEASIEIQDFDEIFDKDVLLVFFRENIGAICAHAHFGGYFDFENNFLRGNFMDLLVEKCSLNEVLIFKKICELCLKYPMFQSEGETELATELLAEIKSKLQDKINGNDSRNSSFKQGLIAKRRIEFNKLSNERKLLLIERDGHECKICKAQMHLTVDHVMPLSRGGSDDLKNLQLLCKSCNSQKSNKRTDLEPIEGPTIYWNEIGGRMPSRGNWK